MNATVDYHLSTTQDGGYLWSTFPKDTTSELAGFVFTLSFMLSAKQEAVNTNFLKFLVWPDPESNTGSTVSQADAPSHSANDWKSGQRNVDLGVLMS